GPRGGAERPATLRARPGGAPEALRAARRRLLRDPARQRLDRVEAFVRRDLFGGDRRAARGGPLGPRRHQHERPGVTPIAGTQGRSSVRPLPARLDVAFFDRSVHEVANELIGCTLTYEGVGGVIVETERYEAADPACHAFGGR